MSESKQKTVGVLKKAMWVVLPIVIIAVVVIAVFAGQSNSLSDQIAQLESDKAALSRKLDEADMAVRTAQELSESERVALNEQIEAADARALEAESKAEAAETKIQEAETKVQAAETKIQEAETKAQAAEAQAQEAAVALSDMTTARDQLQEEKDQITDGIRQVQSALSILVSDDTVNQLKEAQQALAAVTLERDELQNAVATLEKERDELQRAVEAAASQAAELQTVQEALAAVTEERDGLIAAAKETAQSVRMVVSDAAGNAVQELEELTALNQLKLEAGSYTVTVSLLNANGEATAQTSFPYTVE